MAAHLLLWTRRSTMSFVALLLCFVQLATATAPPPLESAQYAPGFAVLPPVSVPHPAGPETQELDFRLTHVFHHGTYKHPNLHKRFNVTKNRELWINTDDEHASREPAPRLRARSQPLNIQRLVDRSRPTINSILDHGRMTGKPVSLPASAWTIDEVAGPNVTDKETVLSFARMASNAYIVLPGEPGWEDVGGGFNYTEDFGWESDGLRGHIFADTKNRTVVIGLKGTSPAVFDGHDTTTNDKINDNLFFSCCCGQGGQYLWRQVCDCQTSTYTCNSTCLVKALKEKNRYYYAAQDLYHNVTELYPDADIWVAGHSLGGSVSSLLALTYGLPVVTFEAPGEAMPAARLGLPTPPGYRVGSHQERAYTGGYHFGHTADPIFMGTCNSAVSGCTLAGYAMQSVCHTGSECVYDTVGDYGWRPGIGYHRIVAVIRDVLEKYDTPAVCNPHVNCSDCYLWNYFESNGSDTTTSSRSFTISSTRTRTETCKTPGWWGCLDESTTTTTTTSSESTSTSSKSTCKTPGWFGCKDPTTTTTTTTTTTSSTSHKHHKAKPAPTITKTSSPTASLSATTSCKTPGWFGCDDPTTIVTSSLHTPTVTSGSATSSSTTCTSKEWFGLICVDPSPVESESTIGGTKPTAIEPPRGRSRCVRRSWWGGCREWDRAWEL